MSKQEKPDVWFPLMVSAYLKKTMGLNTEQHGAYLLLLINYWVDGPPPDDDTYLAGIARMTPAGWRKMRPVMLRYFEIRDGHWRQERADEERERWSERKRRFSERASAGGRAKAAKSTATSTPKALLASCTPSSSVSSVVSSNEEPTAQIASPDQRAWSDAVSLLVTSGRMSEVQARSFFGKLVADHQLQPRDLLGALGEAYANGTQDPQGWLFKAARSRGQRRHTGPEKRLGFV